MAKPIRTKKTKKALNIKKRWVTILAPDIFNKMPIGESTVSDPEKLVGRRVKVNLMKLTRNMRQQNINIKFRITRISDGNALTETIRYDMNPSSIKRFVKRRISRLDESFIVFTADNRQIRLKPMIITKSKVRGLVKADLRKVIIEHLTREIKNKSYTVFLKEIISNRLQKDLQKVLNKIYPIRIVAIRSMYLDESKMKVRKEVVEESKEEVVEEAPAEEVKVEEKKEEAVEEKPAKKEKVEKEEIAEKKEAEDKPKKKKEAKKTSEELSPSDDAQKVKLSDKEEKVEVSEELSSSDDAQKPEVSDKPKAEEVKPAEE